MIKYLKNLLLYGNTDRDTFKRIYPSIVESGRKNMFALSGIVLIAMVCMFVATFFNEYLTMNRPFYVICIVVNLILLYVVRRSSSDDAGLVFCCVYIFIAMLFAFGIALATMVEPDEPTVSFLIILFAVPLLFSDIPLRMDICIVIGIVVYIIVAKFTQSEEIFDYNMASVIPYGIISIVVCTYMMTIKVRRLALEYENKYLSESDQLTGMLNRRCYEQKLEYFRQNGCPEGMMIYAFDINGLKLVNDHMGHHVGDELICGGADCIGHVFGEFGTCYRIGGDEFIAIVEHTVPYGIDLQERLLDECRSFHGNYISSLSISMGMVVAQYGDEIDELIKQADQALYQDKANYYQQRAVDRRRR